MMKKIFMIFLSLVFSILLVDCGSEKTITEVSTQASESDNQTYIIKVATWFPEGHPQIEALNMFKEDIAKGTNGNIEVQIYSNSQLG